MIDDERLVGLVTLEDVRQLPVVRDGALAGLLRHRGIIKWLQLESELSVG